MSDASPSSAFVEYAPSEVDLDLAYLASRHGCTPGTLSSLAPGLRGRPPRRPFTPVCESPIYLPLRPSQLSGTFEVTSLNHADLATFCGVENRRRARHLGAPLTPSDLWDDPRNAAFRRRQLELYVSRHLGQFAGDPEARRERLVEFVTSVDRAPGAFPLQEVADVTVPQRPRAVVRVVPAAVGHVATVVLDPPWVAWLVAEVADLRALTLELQRANAAVERARREHAPVAASIKRLRDLVVAMKALGERHYRPSSNLDVVLGHVALVARRVAGDGVTSVFDDARRDLLEDRARLANRLYERATSAALADAIAHLGPWATRAVNVRGGSVSLALALAEVLTNALTQVAVHPRHRGEAVDRMLAALHAMRTRSAGSQCPLAHACAELACSAPPSGGVELPAASEVPPAVPDTALMIEDRFNLALSTMTSIFAEFQGPPSLATHLLTVGFIALGTTPAQMLSRRPGGEPVALGPTTLESVIGEWVAWMAPASDEVRQSFEGPLRSLAKGEVTALRARVDLARARAARLDRLPEGYRLLNSTLLLLNVVSMIASVSDALADPPRVRAADRVQALGSTGVTLASGASTVLAEDLPEIADLRGYLRGMLERWNVRRSVREAWWIPEPFTTVSAIATAAHGALVFLDGERTGALVDFASAAVTYATLAPPPFDVLAAVALATNSIVTTLNPRFWLEVRHPEPAWHAAWTLVEAIWNHDDVATLRDRDPRPPAVTALIALRASLDDLGGATFPAFPPGDPARIDAWNSLRDKGFVDAELSFILGPSRAPTVDHVREHPNLIDPQANVPD